MWTLFLYDFVMAMGIVFDIYILLFLIYIYFYFYSENWQAPDVVVDAEYIEECDPSPISEEPSNSSLKTEVQNSWLKEIFELVFTTGVPFSRVGGGAVPTFFILQELSGEDTFGFPEKTSSEALTDLNCVHLFFFEMLQTAFYSYYEPIISFECLYDFM